MLEFNDRDHGLDFTSVAEKHNVDKFVSSMTIWKLWADETNFSKAIALLKANELTFSA
jgi:hypothetical protein